MKDAILSLYTILEWVIHSFANTGQVWGTLWVKVDISWKMVDMFFSVLIQTNYYSHAHPGMQTCCSRILRKLVPCNFNPRMCFVATLGQSQLSCCLMFVSVRDCLLSDLNQWLTQNNVETYITYILLIWLCISGHGFNHQTKDILVCTRSVIVLSDKLVSACLLSQSAVLDKCQTVAVKSTLQCVGRLWQQQWFSV